MRIELSCVLIVRPGSSDDWLNVFTKYFPFIVVTLIVLVTTSCIVVAACIYVSYRCKSLPLRSSACDSEPALLLYNNYAFKPKGVRLEVHLQLLLGAIQGRHLGVFQHDNLV